MPGIQIGHAGRKASANKPWEGDDHIPDGDPRAWETISPSAIAFGGGLPKVPREMTLADIERVKADHVAAARRALAAGFKWLELHFAHGYLAQSFFSIHANQRTDGYGGDAVRRRPFLEETLSAVREVWPDHLPLDARLGVIEYDGRDEETLAGFHRAGAAAQGTRPGLSQYQHRVFDEGWCAAMGAGVPGACLTARAQGAWSACRCGLGNG